MTADDTVIDVIPTDAVGTDEIRFRNILKRLAKLEAK